MGDLVKINILSLKALTHQTGIKELAAMKADRCIASCPCLYQNTTLEHTAETDGTSLYILCLHERTYLSTNI